MITIYYITTTTNINIITFEHKHLRKYSISRITLPPKKWCTIGEESSNNFQIWNPSSEQLIL